MGERNRTGAAARLLTEIESWCVRTGTQESLIGRVLFRHPGFVPLLRKRLTVSPEKEAQVRAFLTANPDGWDGVAPKCHGFGVTRPSKKQKETRGQRTSAFAPGYGARPTIGSVQLGWAMENAVRELDGLERFKLPDGIAEACRIDGRPYTEFLAALVWMGLECWKDDRDAHRERGR